MTVDNTNMSDCNGRPNRGRVRLRRELPAVLCLALLLAVVTKTFLVQTFYIPTPSMEPTLLVNDRVLVIKLFYTVKSMEQGDVIVFDSPLLAKHGPEPLARKVFRNLKEILGLQPPNRHLIKRVIAVGGDRVGVQEGHVLVNGSVLSEPYLMRNSSMEDNGPFYIPAGHFWVMGDNRDNSRDSRWFGPISAETVIGRVAVRVWPITRERSGATSVA